MLSVNKAFFKILAVFAALSALTWAPAAPLRADISGDKTIQHLGVVDVAALNMRSCPEPGCRIIRVLVRGEVIGITGETGDWLEIRHENATGYVFGAKGYVRRHAGIVPDADDFSGVEDAVEKAEEIEKLISQRQETVAEMERRAAEVTAALEGIDKALAAAGKNLEDVREARAEIEMRIQKTDREIAETRAVIEQQRDYAEERLVALYKLNRLGGMNLLATAGSTSDLFRRKAAMEAIVARDEIIINRLVSEEKRLAGLLGQAAGEKAQKEALEKQYGKTMADLAGKQRQRQQLLSGIKSEQSRALIEIEYFEQAARRLDEVIGALKQRAVDRGAGKQKVFSEYKGLLKMPVDGKLMSRFGRYTEPQSGAVRFRNGIELQANRGAPVRAVFDGETSFSDWIAGFGRVIIISHGNSFYTVYGHLEELFAAEGDVVKANEVIATVGESGSITGPALYFEIRHKGSPLDPLDWIEKG